MKNKCKYCEHTDLIVMKYDKAEAKKYAEHLKHKTKNY